MSEAIKAAVETAILGQITQARIQLCDSSGEVLVNVGIPNVRPGDTISYTVPTEIQVAVR